MKKIILFIYLCQSTICGANYVYATQKNVDNIQQPPPSSPPPPPPHHQHKMYAYERDKFLGIVYLHNKYMYIIYNFRLYMFHAHIMRQRQAAILARRMCEFNSYMLFCLHTPLGFKRAHKCIVRMRTLCFMFLYTYVCVVYIEHFDNGSHV